MQRHNVPVQISMFTSPEDTYLWKIKTTLEATYWNTKDDGVFEFQFHTDNEPLTNVPGPLRFNLVRYTPDIYFKSFAFSIPGILHNDGTFSYGGGRTGALIDDKISWDDGSSWVKVDSVPTPGENPINLIHVRDQAKLDSWVMGNIEQKYYW